jgi:hypothetical protein
MMKKSELLSGRCLVTVHKALNYYTSNMQNHWLLHKMSITPNIVMTYRYRIDIQGVDHHCQEEQGILGMTVFPLLNGLEMLPISANMYSICGYISVLKFR